MHIQPAQRTRLGAVAGVFSIFLFVWSAIEFSPLHRPEPPFDLPVLLMIGGALALGLAIHITGKRDPVTMPRDLPLTPGRPRWRYTFIGILLLALAAEISGGGLRLSFIETVSTHLQFAIWFCGVALVGYGMAGAPLIRMPRYKSRHLLVLGMILMLAFAVRVIGLGETIWQSIDELHWMEGVQMIGWERDAYDLLRSPSDFQGVTAVYTYWNAGTVALFGSNLFGLRFVNAIVGVLTVLAMYGLGRALFDRQMAVIAALVLATFPPHLQFSRIALAHITDGFVGIALIMFVVRGMRWGKRVDWAAAGLTLGLSQYFFETGRLLFPILTLAWFVGMLIVTPNARKHWRGMAIALLTALMIAAPVYYGVAVRGGVATARLNHSSSLQSDWIPLLQDGIQAGDLEQMAEWLIIPFRFFVNARESVDFWGGPFSLLHPLMLPLFFFGVFYCLWRFRSPLNVFPLFVILTGLGSAFLVNKWGSPRYIIVMPVLALMIAIGIRYAFTLMLAAVKALRPEFNPARADGIFRLDHLWIALAVCVTLFHGVYYFSAHLSHFNNRLITSRPYPDMFDAVQRAARDFDFRTTQVYLVSTFQADWNLARGMYGFMVGTQPYPLETMPVERFTLAFLESLPRDRNYLFMLEPGLNPSANLLYATFPRTYPPQPSDRHLPPPKQFWAYYVPLLNTP